MAAMTAVKITISTMRPQEDDGDNYKNSRLRRKSTGSSNKPGPLYFSPHQDLSSLRWLAWKLAHRTA